ATALTDDVFGVSAERVFGDALTRRVVDVDQTEPLAIAVVPLKVVEERPVEVTEQRNAVGDGASELAEMPQEKIHAFGIVHGTVERDPVAIGHAIFGDQRG